MMSLSTEASLIITLSIVFSTGFLSGLSPCTLPTVVFVSAYVTGRQDYSKKKGFMISLAFVLGIAFMLSILGVFAGIAGKLLMNSRLLNYIMAAILIIMGLWLLKVFEFNSGGGMMNKLNIKKGSGLISAFLLGIPFGISASPCTMPITASVLAYSATRGSALLGAVMMFTFAMGRSIPLIIVGTFTGTLKNFEKLSKYRTTVEKAAGIILILLAFYFIWQA
ncbi:MAG: cytochrome c biogenesis protein CcdA [Firmicutes bacterium]|nr:cytochrome c biogenesis protein CcdA [Bacillota bacterium]